MKGFLLDVNLLIALSWPNHPQHELAHDWFARENVGGWGTCTVSQIGFVRVSSHPALPFHVSTQEALHKLGQITALPTHRFWPESPSGFANDAFSMTAPNIFTHGLVTDGFLVTIAASHGGKLATLDRQLARTFGDRVCLVTSNT